MSHVQLFEAVEQFLDAARGTVSPSTLQLYKHYLAGFKRFAGNPPLAKVTPAFVLRFSVKYHPVGVVQRLFSWATNEARILGRNPIAGMRRVRNGHRRRILDPVELARLLRASRPAFRRFAVAMLETIARPREMREVRWGEVRTSGSPSFAVGDLVAGRAFFSIDRFKGQTLRRDRYAVRVIPISPRLGRLLVRLWGAGQADTCFIFLNTCNRPWTKNAVRCQFRRLRVRAGLAADLAGENVVAYSLRHTSATGAVGAGVKGFTLAELMGHSDIRMTQRYVHLRPDHLLDAMERIAAWKQGRRVKNDRLGSLRRSPD